MPAKYGGFHEVFRQGGDAEVRTEIHQSASGRGDGKSFGRLGYMRVQAALMQDDVFRRTQIQMSRTLYGEGDGIKQAKLHGALSNAQVAGKDDFAGLKLVGCRRIPIGEHGQLLWSLGG